MNLLKSTGIIGGMTMVSRLFGFVRDVLIARILGASALSDAWQLAFQMPNIFRRLFAEGAFSAAFVPLFNGKMEESEGRGAAQGFVTEVLSVFVPILLLFTAVMMIIMPGAIWVLDDFGRGGRSSDFAVSLARITFPYLGLISVTTLFAAILNSLSRFTAAAAAPILLNICMITGMLGVLYIDGGHDTKRAAYVLAFAVAIAGLLQMFWLYYWARKSGFRFHLARPKFTEDVRMLGRLIVPAIFGAGIYQVSRFVDLFFLGRLQEGSFTYLAMADRLNQLPLGIIGIALGTAILPALSRFIAKDDTGGAQRVQSNAIELGMLLTVPAAVGLYFTAQPLVSAIYLGGKYGMADVDMTAAVVSMLVIGLPAYVLVKVLTPAFFARKDTRTPVMTAAISLAINIVLNLILIPIMGVPGLALAGAIAAWSNTVMLYFILHRRGYYHVEGSLLLRIGRIAFSAAAMGAVLYYAMPYGASYYGGNIGERALSIALLCGAGAIVYFALAWMTGAIDRDKINMLRRRKAAEQAANTEGNA
ncbi:murein biosynthesis integral membrane protein MurJ [Sphingorhabdus sp. Alg239-R122]|uniref:murein biosynthesis integral membrane protein MurJ n=1 Tax=Sphingorhabdus sp. Alg239-R122 TaxID=2305989 RepID=UPI0013DB06B5|nr:murein biosynthesis integral membrane protein MurJ [Sphingorhabdus sp. Alg239-R122]